MPTVAMVMIAKDEAANIERCFNSFWEHVDQVILVDTGSTDGTVKAAEDFAASRGEPSKLTVGHFEWCDDFAKARQASWDLIRCDFAAWIDLDDTIRGGEHLRHLAAAMPPPVTAYLMPYEYARDDNGNITCLLERERLIRQGPRQEWRLPVHEVLDLDGAFARSDMVVWEHHRDHDNRPVPERNLRILQADLDRSNAAGEEPSTRTLAYLGVELIALGRPLEAIEHLQRYLEVSPDKGEEACQTAHKLSIAHRMVMDQDGQDREERLRLAEQAGLQAVACRPDWADGYLDLADVALARCEWDRALRNAQRARELGVPRTLLIVNPLDYQYAPLLMEATALLNMGRLPEAMERTEQALRLTPERPDLKAQQAFIGDRLKTENTVSTVMTLFELLVRHDEIVKAVQLMDTVPYYCTDHPRIAQARLDVREMALHANDPELYKRFYREDERIFLGFEHHGKPVEQAGEMFPRAHQLKEALKRVARDRKDQSRPLRVLDLSAHDGWLAAYLHSQDLPVVVDLMDMNPDAADAARKRGEDCPGIGEVVCDDLHHAAEHYRTRSYDAVVLFETIEHVPDVAFTLDVMESMCKPTVGTCYISTPDGAYERGDIPNWDRVEPKGHLRAIRPADLADWLCQRGLIDDMAVLPDRTLYAAWRPKQRAPRVVFYAGGVEAKPEAIIAGGQGGSETALCKMAEEFARRGHDVRVYAGTGEGGLRSDQVSLGGLGNRVPDGQVLYAPATAWDPGDPCELLVVSRIPEVFDRTIAAKHTALWLHDAEYDNRLTPARCERVDRIIVLSQWQREQFAARYPWCADKLTLSRNGIEPRFYTNPRPIGERKPWVVYSSSPDRGLDILLQVWPRVRERVPDAELHHTYAPVYHQFKDQYPHLKTFHRRLEQLGEGLEGVVAHQNMGQRDLAELYQQARCWAYPSYTGWSKRRFPEIFCITATECQAAGCVPVALSYAALRETVRSGLLIQGDPASQEWQDRFVDGIVRALTDDEWAAECGAEGRRAALDYDWSGVCDHWTDLFLTTPKPLELAA